MAGTISATTASLIAAAIGAAGVGTGLYESHEAGVNQDKAQAANKAALLGQQQAAAKQADLTKQQAVMGAQGQAQSQTGGSLTDPGTTSLADLLAGYPGYGAGGGAGTATPGAGGSSGATPSSTSSGAPPDIAAILAALKGGGGAGGQFGGGSGSSISGGNWQPQPTQPQSSFELANPPLT